MKVKVIIILIVLIMLIALFTDFTYAEQQNLNSIKTEKIEAIEYTEANEVQRELTKKEQAEIYKQEIKSKFRKVNYKSYNTEEELNQAINDLTSYQNELLESISLYPIKYRPLLTFFIRKELNKIEELISLYNEEIDAIFWEEKKKEYPAATEVWLFLKEQGWSDAVCAGILGNMMIECGGHTLSLQWWLYDYSGWFYGICQWHKGYFPEVQGQNLQFQLNYLVNSMDEQFGMFGANALSRFLSMTNPADAAYDFARKYERCAQTEYNYTSRQKCAWIAYNYFTN